MTAEELTDIYISAMEKLGIKYALAIDYNTGPANEEADEFQIRLHRETNEKDFKNFCKAAVMILYPDLVPEKKKNGKKKGDNTLPEPRKLKPDEDI